MIGNDIIDLSLANVQSIWRRKGYLDKLFSDEERKMIMTSSEPDILIWRLWSMKESAYKAQLRCENLIRFNPIAYECQILNKRMGNVFYQGKKYVAVSDVLGQYVYTEVRRLKHDLNHFSEVIEKRGNQLESKSLYSALVSNLASKKGWPRTEIRIEKNPLGIPEVYLTGQKTSVLCSFSHHGAYGAYLVYNP